MKNFLQKISRFIWNPYKPLPEHFYYYKRINRSNSPLVGNSIELLRYNNHRNDCFDKYFETLMIEEDDWERISYEEWLTKSKWKATISNREYVSGMRL